jgi:hypothetical protein
MMRPLAVVLPLLLATASCVNLRHQRERANDPIPEAVTDDLRPNHSTFGEVLDLLGAPVIVWPSLNGRIVMAYAWLDSSSWGLSLSYSLRQLVGASFDWDSEHAEVPAVLLEFDPDLRLRIVRRGLLRDIAPGVAEGEDGEDGAEGAADLLRTYR